MKRFLGVLGALALIFMFAFIPISIWFYHTFTIVKSQVSDEFMLLRAEQYKECTDGGGCSVYSVRERRQEVMMNLDMFIRQNGLFKKDNSL